MEEEDCHDEGTFQVEKATGAERESCLGHCKVRCHITSMSQSQDLQASLLYLEPHPLPTI